MDDWEAKFGGSSDRTLRGSRLVAEFAQHQGLQRKDEKQKSVMWGTPTRDILWCFADHAQASGGSRSGLELFMRHVPDDVADQLRRKLETRFGAPQSSDPKIAWGTVVARWNELRDEVLVPYVEALSSS